MYISLDGLDCPANVSSPKKTPSFTKSVVGDVELVSRPFDHGFESWLQVEMGEMIEEMLLILLVVLVVERTEELGDRFLLRDAGGGAGFGGGALRPKPCVLTCSRGFGPVLRKGL